MHKSMLWALGTGPVLMNHPWFSVQRNHGEIAVER